jgi:hypothetical protein
MWTPSVYPDVFVLFLVYEDVYRFDSTQRCKKITEMKMVDKVDSFSEIALELDNIRPGYLTNTGRDTNICSILRISYYFLVLFQNYKNIRVNISSYVQSISPYVYRYKCVKDPVLWQTGKRGNEDTVSILKKMEISAWT